MKRLFYLYMMYCLSAAILGGGCSRHDLSGIPTDSGGEDVLRVTTQLSGKASDPESAIRTLRLFVFSEVDGRMLLNKLYYTSEALTAVPADSYTYFAWVGGSYRISELLPRETIQVVLVANEASALNGNYTLDRLKGAVVNYYDIYEDSGAMNIVIDGRSTTSNKGYIPMYAESASLTHYEWNAGNGRTVEMPLVRTLAKVVLRLNKGEGGITGLYPRDKLTISSASVVFVPEYSFLGNEGLPYDDAPVNTLQENLNPAFEITAATGKDSSDVLSFYVPEHILSDLTFNSARYTYLRINATYYSDVTKETTNSSYRIPIGNGVRTTSVAGLSKADLSVTRNTLYNINARVTSVGKLEVFQIQVVIKPWEKTEDVEGDIEGPWLNVTSANVGMSQRVVRVHFWSNQSDLSLEASGQLSGGGNFTVNDVFMNLVPGDHFKLYAKGEGGYTDYNGYMDLEFVRDDLYRNGETYTLWMKAGKLKRSITIVANPKVGEIVFDANGGTGSYTKEVRYADLNGRPFLGNEIALTVPMDGFTAPVGKEFVLWMNENGEEVAAGSGTNEYVVKLAGYTTRIKALWKTKN